MLLCLVLHATVYALCHCVLCCAVYVAFMVVAIVHMRLSPHMCPFTVCAMCCVLQLTVQHFISRIPTAVRAEYKTSISGTISMAIIYNPHLVLATLQEIGATGTSRCRIAHTHTHTQSNANCGRTGVM
jgi:hypothetical protein